MFLRFHRSQVNLVGGSCLHIALGIILADFLGGIKNRAGRGIHDVLRCITLLLLSSPLRFQGCARLNLAGMRWGSCFAFLLCSLALLCLKLVKAHQPFSKLGVGLAILTHAIGSRGWALNELIHRLVKKKMAAEMVPQTWGSRNMAKTIEKNLSYFATFSLSIVQHFCFKPHLASTFFSRLEASHLRCTGVQGSLRCSLGLAAGLVARPKSKVPRLVWMEPPAQSLQKAQQLSNCSPRPLVRFWKDFRSHKTPPFTSSGPQISSSGPFPIDDLRSHQTHQVDSLGRRGDPNRATPRKRWKWWRLLAMKDGDAFPLQG